MYRAGRAATTHRATMQCRGELRLAAGDQRTRSCEPDCRVPVARRDDSAGPRRRGDRTASPAASSRSGVRGISMSSPRAEVSRRQPLRSLPRRQVDQPGRSPLSRRCRSSRRDPPAEFTPRHPGRACICLSRAAPAADRSLPGMMLSGSRLLMLVYLHVGKICAIDSYVLHLAD
jgi:hypothetical protein